MRRDLVSVLCLAAALLIGVAAVFDHANKQARGNHAQLLEWYCTHDGTLCGGPSSAQIEERWEWRERGYEAAVAVLSVFAIARFAHRRARR